MDKLMFPGYWVHADVNTDEHVERKDIIGLPAPEEEKITV